MDDLEGVRQVGCGQEQDLKRAKAAVLAIARMVRSLFFFFPFFSLHIKKPPAIIIACGTSSASEANTGAFCLAAYGESRWYLPLWLMVATFNVYVLSFLLLRFFCPFGFLLFGHFLHHLL